MRFRMHKWYLDCVTASGEAAIVYSAQLHWGVLRLGYSAVILAELGHEPDQRQTWRTDPPRPDGQELRWASSRLGAEGCWKQLDPGPEVQLHDGIRWRCHQPGGPARLRLGSGRVLTGLGYAEELTLELPPWRLPFDELRWGRFIADAGAPAMAWIQWRKGLERGWCFQGRQTLDLDECTDDRVRFPQGRIVLHPGRPLREGFLLRELLGAGAELCPGPLRMAHESKRLSRGTLEDGTGFWEGWVIHERVQLR